MEIHLISLPEDGFLYGIWHGRPRRSCFVSAIFAPTVDSWPRQLNNLPLDNT